MTAETTSLVVRQPCRPTSILHRSQGAQSRYPEHILIKLAAAMRRCCFSWLQESCAVCQAAVQDQGFEAAQFSTEGGIRGTDIFVLVILCRTGKSNLVPIAERHRSRMGLPLGLMEASPLPPASAARAAHAAGFTASCPESGHLTDFLALCAAPRDVTLPCV